VSDYVNTPVCEACWIHREATWDENDSDVLIGLRLPVRVVDLELEQCGFCGKPTFIGIFQRAKRSEAAFYMEEPETP